MLSKRKWDSLRVGDIVRERYQQCFGTIVDVPTVTHPKEVLKVVVLTDRGLETWTAQFCELISEAG